MKPMSLPLKVMGMGDIVDANGRVVLDNKTLRVGPEALAFIVRAVNSHEELLSACGVALDALLTDGYGETSHLVQIIRAAILKAEGRKS